jgi:hypothetical protein
MPRPRALNSEQDKRLRELALEELTAAEIRAQLVDEGLITGHYPVVKTIQRRMAELRPPDRSERWSFANADPEVARLVLPVLAAVLEKTQGRLYLSQDTADWIVRLKTAAPTLADDWWTYVYARTYQRDGERAIWLDRFLAFRPWESNEAYARYQQVEAYIATSGFDRLMGVSPLTEPMYVRETPEESATNWEREEADAQSKEDVNDQTTRT